MSADFWSTEDFLVQADEPTVGLGTQHIATIEYGDGSIESESGVCNLTRSDGVVCRLWVGHGGPHLPVSIEIAHTRRPIFVSMEEL